jgi:aminoglycoside/choline kinase family phosphotransferase
MVCDSWPAGETPDFLAVAEHLRSSGICVPHVYGTLPAAGWMCLEDFGDRTLAAAWQTASMSERLLWGWRAMRILIHLHTTATQRYEPACPAFRLAFDVPKLLSELQFFRQHAIEGLWRHALTDAERDAFDAVCHPLCAFLAGQPRYFCHRDYHGWNIMVQEERLGILDFQDARMGPQAYDVVSLLVDRGTPAILGKEVSAALVEHYLQSFETETGQQVHRQDFAVLFELAAVQRCLKAIGTFAAMHVVRQRSQYLGYIPPTLAYVRPLLQRHQILRSLEAVLRRYTPLDSTT